MTVFEALRGDIDRGARGGAVRLYKEGRHMQDPSKKHPWLKLLRKHDGADHVKVSNEDSDCFLREHRHQLRRNKQWILGLILFGAVLVGSLLIHLALVTKSRDELSARYRSLSTAIDRFFSVVDSETSLSLSPVVTGNEERLREASRLFAETSKQYHSLSTALNRFFSVVDSETLLPPPPDQGDIEKRLVEMTRLLVKTDQAFHLFAGMTHGILQNRLEHTAEDLAFLGVEAEQLFAQSKKSASTGGLEPDDELTDILARYVNDDLYEELDSLLTARQFIGSMPHIAPVANAIVSSPFGLRRHPVTGKVYPHYGVDYISLVDTGVFATGSGRVVFAGEDGSFGNVLIIDHGGGLRTLYAHLRSFAVERDAFVEAGQRIGVVGKTGASKGIHLHYEVQYNGKRLNPLKVLKIARKIKNKEDRSLL